MENLPSGAFGREKYKSGASNTGRTGQEIKEGASPVAIKNLSNSKLKPDVDIHAGLGKSSLNKTRQSEYNSCGQSRLREIFLIQDNFIQLLDEDDDEEDEELVPTLIPDVVNAAKPIVTKAKTVAKPKTSSKQKVTIVDPKKDSSDDSIRIWRVILMTQMMMKMTLMMKRKPNSQEAHVATPHPVKQAGKTQAGKGQQSPKSDAKITYKSCTNTFTSDSALQSHARAKHDAK
ncbi:histone deacetylase HDT1-like [Impatiens glandulifera]|uniref:histone deacetylase HDT1-like n=1 Tax=Impatiens glandulifera TaxID=253017 RepID=UPI001FB0AAC9|nr:histone deacetylase HDT1-like [Impatiens glandulifera]